MKEKPIYIRPEVSEVTLQTQDSVLEASNEGFGEKSGIYDNWPEMS